MVTGVAGQSEQLYDGHVMRSALLLNIWECVCVWMGAFPLGVRFTLWSFSCRRNRFHAYTGLSVQWHRHVCMRTTHTFIHSDKQGIVFRIERGIFLFHFFFSFFLLGFDTSWLPHSTRERKPLCGFGGGGCLHVWGNLWNSSIYHKILITDILKMCFR